VILFPKYKENVKKSQKITCSRFFTGFLSIRNATMLLNALGMLHCFPMH
jgi:hypothetical protein